MSIRKRSTSRRSSTTPADDSRRPASSRSSSRTTTKTTAKTATKPGAKTTTKTVKTAKSSPNLGATTPKRTRDTTSRKTAATAKPRKPGKPATSTPSTRGTKQNISRGATKQTKRTPATPAESLTEYRRKRDFKKTPEPSGAESHRRVGKLRFVIQKHDATQLHFDLRLELDGVMKSWAVPKGPSANPEIKRLAMQVEDHPISYNTFEGTIPEGEYGGGTVMLWDTGTYTPEGSPSAADDENTARAGYDRGDFKVNFHGKRMAGSYVLVRTRGFGGRSSSKPSWLLIKHRDASVRDASEPDLVDEYVTSVTTGRTMDEITAGK